MEEEKKVLVSEKEIAKYITEIFGFKIKHTQLAPLILNHGLPVYTLFGKKHMRVDVFNEWYEKITRAELLEARKAILKKAKDENKIVYLSEMVTTIKPEYWVEYLKLMDEHYLWKNKFSKRIILGVAKKLLMLGLKPDFVNGAISDICYAMQQETFKKFNKHGTVTFAMGKEGQGGKWKRFGKYHKRVDQHGYLKHESPFKKDKKPRKPKIEKDPTIL